MKILSLHMRYRASLAIFFSLLSFIVHAEQQELFKTIETRPGVFQSFMLLVTDNPVGSVVLFAGGSGVLKLSANGYGRGKVDFAVRSRRLFMEQGFNVAVVDAASDFKKKSDGLSGYRNSKEHAKDIRGVISYLQKLAAKPVWVIGFSRGTISAANAAAQLNVGGPNGLVLTSSVTEPSKGRPLTVFDIKLEGIKVPTLIVHHESDACHVTPLRGVMKIKKKLKNIKKVEVQIFKGGDDPKGGGCGAYNYHGFPGIEPKVVKTITNWVKQNI